MTSDVSRGYRANWNTQPAQPSGPLSFAAGSFESGYLRRRIPAVYRADGDQGVAGFGWSTPSTQMSARSL